MKTSADGEALIRHSEDVRKYVYLDEAGLPTIGVGHLLTKDELSSGKIAGEIEWTSGITEAQVETILKWDLADAETAVGNFVEVPLEQHQFDALVSFVYNIGQGAFAHSTLLRLLNDGGYEAVPDQMRRWIWSAGRKLPELEKRREKEVSMWLA